MFVLKRLSCPYPKGGVLLLEQAGKGHNRMAWPCACLGVPIFVERHATRRRGVKSPTHMGALRLLARPNLLFGRKRGNLAPLKRCAMGLRAIKKSPPTPNGADGQTHPHPVGRGQVVYGSVTRRLLGGGLLTHSAFMTPSRRVTSSLNHWRALAVLLNTRFGAPAFLASERTVAWCMSSRVAAAKRETLP